MHKKLRVAVLMGGKTAEHAVSLNSGMMVVNNLDKQTLCPSLNFICDPPFQVHRIRQIYREAVGSRYAVSEIADIPHQNNRLTETHWSFRPTLTAGLALLD